MENKKEIGKLFKDNLENLDYSPSHFVWDKIEIDLKKEKRKKRFFFWILFCGTLAVGMSGYLYLEYKSNQKENTNYSIRTSKKSQANDNNKNSNKKDSSENKINQEYNFLKAEKENRNSYQEDSIKNNFDKDIKTKKNGKYYYNLFSNNQIRSINDYVFNRIKSTSKINNSKSRIYRSTNNIVLNNINSIYKLNRHNNYNNLNNYKKSTNKGNDKYSIQNKFEKNLNIDISRQRDNIKTIKSQRNSKQSKINLIYKGTFLDKKNSVELSLKNELFLEKSKNKELNTEQNLDECCDENCIVIIEKEIKKIKKELTIKKEDSIIKPTKKTIIFSPIVGINRYNKIGQENNYGNSEVVKNQIKEGTLLGAKFKWMFSEKIGIQSGAILNTFYYNTTILKNNGYLETESVDLNQDPNELNNKFNIDSKVTFEQHLKYLEIPFEAYCYFNTRKLSHATSFGLSFYFPIKNQVNVYSDNSQKINIGQSLAYLKQGYGINLNYYLNYNITDKIQLFISPAAQFQFLGNLDYPQPTSTNLSLSTGINYKF